MTTGAAIDEGVPVSPELATEANLRRLKQTFRLWVLLRHEEAQRSGPGFIPKSDVLALLQRLAWGRSRSYELINQGLGIFWVEESMNARRHGGRPVLRLIGARALAEAWDIGRMSTAQPLIPLVHLLPPGHRGSYKGTDVWNALLYHVQLPRKRQDIILRKTKLPLLVRKSNRPVSRAALSNITGVSKRSQRRYERMKQAPGKPWGDRGPKVSVKRVNFVSNQMAEIRTRSGLRIVPRRLPNSYSCRLERRGYGQAKEHNELSRHQAHSAAGPSYTGRFRTYFESVRGYSQATGRGEDIREPLLRRRSSRRRSPSKGADIWEHIDLLQFELPEVYVYGE